VNREELSCPSARRCHYIGRGSRAALSNPGRLTNDVSLIRFKNQPESVKRFVSIRMSDSPAHKQKLYCYVDESGQDTTGELFFVVVAILSDDRDDIRRYLTDLEERSGKRARKWSRSTPRQRVAYIQGVLSRAAFGGLYYSKYQESRAYVDLTILSVAKAINTHTAKPYAATIYVDGLQRTEEHRFARGLRKLRISARKVRGMKDEGDVFIRLSDALAGFVRDALAHDERFAGFYREAMVQKRIQEV
jgi:hypothetical protein